MLYSQLWGKFYNKMKVLNCNKIIMVLSGINVGSGPLPFFYFQHFIKYFLINPCNWKKIKHMLSSK